MIDIPQKLNTPKKPGGIVMPISASGDYTSEHWSDVKGILSSAIEKAGYSPQLVSEEKAVGIIHGRIVKNLYEHEVVVCDVSNLNPNVMLELGLRLAFDKPTVIIKDDKTKYSFDTSPIEHLEYPSQLHYGLIGKFIEDLAQKIIHTVQAYNDDPKYSVFLKHFITPSLGSKSKTLPLRANGINILSSNNTRFINKSNTQVPSVEVRDQLKLWKDAQDRYPELKGAAWIADREYITTEEAIAGGTYVFQDNFLLENTQLHTKAELCFIVDDYCTLYVNNRKVGRFSGYDTLHRVNFLEYLIEGGNIIKYEIENQNFEKYLNPQSPVYDAGFANSAEKYKNNPYGICYNLTIR